MKAARPWMSKILIAAGLYNLIYGGWVVLFPSSAFELLEMELPRYLFLWQCIGMIVGVYGVGYVVAARDPIRHWPIVLVGLLGKIFGPIGFLQTVLAGDIPWGFGIMIIFNDLIWWVPFSGILLAALRSRRARLLS